MSTAIELLIKHGYLIVFLAVIAEQIGLPLPSTPILIAAGALAGLGDIRVAPALILAITASLLSDSLWFWFGGRRGTSILAFLSKMSLEPETYLSKARSAYSRHGSGAILAAKFVPGLGTVVPPLAGLSRLAWWKFLLLDAVAALLWAGAYVALGWTFRDQIETIAYLLEGFGAWMAVLAVTLFSFYLLKKYRDRQRIYRELRVRRITAQELKTKMENGERPIIVDLREREEQREGIIPTAIMLSDLTAERVLAGPQSEIVMYCSCPDEFTSAREALRLKRLGLTQVHPLAGGFPRWHELGFPVTQVGTSCQPIVELSADPLPQA